MPQLIRAIVRLVSVLSGISVLVFLIVHAIPGDPAVIAAGMEASQETVERIRRDLGLDRPLPAQFARFVAGALAGDLGTSIRTGVPVADEIRARLPHTLVLTAGGIGVAALLGLITGVILAYPYICLTVKRRHDRNNNGYDAMGLIALSLLWNLLTALGVLSPVGALGGVVGLKILSPAEAKKSGAAQQAGATE